MIEINELAANDGARWDAFVDASPEATFFHRAAWKDVIKKAFGHRTHYLYAETDGKIVGILPLGHIRSRLFTNALISMPFCVSAGPVAQTTAAYSALIDYACGLAKELAVDYLELRNERLHDSEWPTKDLYVMFRKEIDPDPDKNLKAIPRKQRAVVRKGIKAGLIGEIDQELGRFYRAYSESVRNLGTPVFSLNYFRLLKEAFGPECEILTITHNGEAVASVLSFYFRDQVLPYYGGGTNDARVLKANDFMYWELMRRACERGVCVFDYGRSKKGTGSYSFKKNWGFEPIPLHYEYHLVRAREIPDLSPLNPKYQLMINVWRRLPLWLSQRLGPSISKNLG